MRGAGVFDSVTVCGLHNCLFAAMPGEPHSGTRQAPFASGKRREHAAAPRRNIRSSMSGIYIHIPFCRTFCNYCDFHSSLSAANREPLLEAMLAEMEQRRDFLHDTAVETIYVGGGTPSTCTPSQLGAFVGKARELWDCHGLKEVTAEANPDDLSPGYLAGLRATGFDRLSLGVQSFADEHLRWMNRRHSSARAVEAFADARRAGFDNISVDLIYGMAPLSEKQWEHNLKTAVELGPEHISAYHLTVEPDTVFGKRERAGERLTADEESSVRQFGLMREILCGAGYEHYEVSNFALPGRRSAHNSGYWQGREYLGIGPSAHSFDGGARTWSVADNARYLELQPQNKHLETENLTEEDKFNEYLMTSLRHDKGVSLPLLRERFGERRAAYFTDNARRFLDNGTLREAGGTYTIPPEHYFVSDGIISALFLV